MSDEIDKLAHLRRVTREAKKRAPGKAGSEDDHCSFCGKHKSEVKRLVAGPSVFICDECIGECNRLIDSGRG